MRIIWIISLLFFSVFLVFGLQKQDPSNWDILIFTQHWPTTVCYTWMEKTNKNKCTFPKFKDIWTVHGIWPTKLGTRGPEECNTTNHFDPANLAPLVDNLDIFWLNIETNTPKYSFWKHEWVKHGTCAAELEDLNTEAKYFGKGLSWIFKYEMKTVLSKSGIVPDGTKQYFVADFYNAIRLVTAKNPAIECIRNKHLNQTLISEIRLCFDKSLELIDCDGIRGYEEADGKILTNCKADEPILYSGELPNQPTTPRMFYRNSIEAEYDDDEIFMMHDESPDERAKRQEVLRNAVEMYKFVNFLRWMTL